MTAEAPFRLRRSSLLAIPPRLRRSSLLAIPALLASVALAACAGEGSSGGVGSPASDRGGVSAAGGQAMLDAQAAFARCMREQGVDVPDPRSGGGGLELDPGADPASERRFEEAEKACDEERRAIAEAAPTLSAGDRREALENGLRYARCMREQGQDVPDPRATDEGGGTSVEVPSDAKTDPAFQRAARECEGIMREGVGGAP